MLHSPGAGPWPSPRPSCTSASRHRPGGPSLRGRPATARLTIRRADGEPPHIVRSAAAVPILGGFVGDLRSADIMSQRANSAWTGHNRRHTY